LETALNNTSSIRLLTASRLKRRAKTPIALHMTAMIDIIFLLLTFFVLTSNFRLPEDFLSLRLPAAAAPATALTVIEPFRIDITTSRGGCIVTLPTGETAKQIRIENESLTQDLAAFADTLGPALTSLKRTAADPIEITCHDDLKWDHLVKIYNIINAMGLSDVTFNLNQARPEPNRR
jgi:biopolymer transport protein ExbD